MQLYRRHCRALNRHSGGPHHHVFMAVANCDASRQHRGLGPFNCSACWASYAFVSAVAASHCGLGCLLLPVISTATTSQTGVMLAKAAQSGLHSHYIQIHQPLLHLQPSCRRSSPVRKQWPLASSRRADSNAATEPQSTAASAASSRQQNGQKPDANIECVATGMDVQCYISDDESSSQTQQQPQTQPHPQPALAGFPANGNGQPSDGQHIDCVATGMDVQCFISDDDETAQAAAPGTAGCAPSTAAAPKTAAAAAASGEGGPLMQLLGAALLVSPFFFWGTSMVAMKVGGGPVLGSTLSGAAFGRMPHVQEASGPIAFFPKDNSD